jgi:N-acyl-D-aspartate/D-glutamate deacylase
MSSSILFQSATVLTGDESTAPFVADVLVSGGYIAQVADAGTLKSEGARKVDAKGHYLSPGFIDMHAHSDLYLITNPVHEAKITQGCTVSLSSTTDSPDLKR